MGQSLFVTMADVKKYTAIYGNVDADKIIQCVKIAQDVHIQNYLGSNLFEKINDLIVAGTLTVGANPTYLTLNTDYIKPMLIHWAMVEYLPWGAYTIANKSIYKHTSESAENVDKGEIDFLIKKAESTATHYTKRFLDYICQNSATYPEYNNNTSEDMYPDKDVNQSNWYL